MHILKISFLFILIITSSNILLGNHLSEVFPDEGKTKQNELAYIDSNIILDTLLILPNEEFDDIFSEKFDSLVNDWYIRSAYNIDNTVNPFISDSILSLCDSIPSKKLITQIPDSVIIQRLESLNSMIDLPYNESVKKMIDLYTCRISGKVEVMLGLSNYYFPIIEHFLDKYQLPLELKYMAIIESALNAKALSRAGASGLWQFMYGTGKIYGLEVTSYVDERRDPVKSTEAAARYLNDLYNIYQDWPLVIAAYNCGPGNVNRAIARSGGKRDYWSVYYRLPRETRGYVPAFISAAYIMNYYKYHNLTPREPSLSIISDTIMISDYLHFNQLSSQLNIDMEMLRELNPMYRKDIIPARKDRQYPLVLPLSSINRFIEIENEIFAYKRELFFPNNKIKNPVIPEPISGVSPNIKGKTKVYYTVKTGDVIGLIADWFNVRTADLKYWNNIHGNMIKVGEKLTIYVPDKSASNFKDFDSMSYNEKQHSIGKTTTPQIVTSTKVTDGSNYIFHTVKSGDNLWDIAKKYPGVNADDIKMLNNITNTRGLYPGQVLKIMKKS